MKNENVHQMKQKETHVDDIIRRFHFRLKLKNICHGFAIYMSLLFRNGQKLVP